MTASVSPSDLPLVNVQEPMTHIASVKGFLTNAGASGAESGAEMEQLEERKLPESEMPPLFQDVCTKVGEGIPAPQQQC